VLRAQLAVPVQPRARTQLEVQLWAARVVTVGQPAPAAAQATKTIHVSYVPSVQTADGNINGSLRFGSNTTYMDYRTCMHEISHTVGIGQASNWTSFISNGLFTGSHANAQLKAINDKLAMPGDGKLHADSQHFWPYGINQQSEVKSEADLIAHCQMVVAIRMDLGLK
jgi:hypothetical protein